MNRYSEFVELHQKNTPLLLGNVWDVSSAIAHEKLGFTALGTSSAAIASTLGYEDGEHMSFDELLFIVERIVKHIHIPLSVDIESGYGETADAIVHNIQALSELGIVGINLEDSIVNSGRRIVPPQEFQRKLDSIVSSLKKQDVNVFLNVRTDTYLLNLANKHVETLERIERYEEAGADGIFIPCLTDPEDIKAITNATQLPVNLMCMPDLPNFDVLKACGVKRISMGNFVHHKLESTLQGYLENIIEKQSFKPLFEHDN